MNHKTEGMVDGSERDKSAAQREIGVRDTPHKERLGCETHVFWQLLENKVNSKQKQKKN